MPYFLVRNGLVSSVIVRKGILAGGALSRGENDQNAVPYSTVVALAVTEGVGRGD